MVLEQRLRGQDSTLVGSSLNDSQTEGITNMTRSLRRFVDYLLGTNNALITKMASIGIVVIFRSRKFSPSNYLLDNPDLAQRGINPHVHAFLLGLREGRVHKNLDIFHLAGLKKPFRNRLSVLVVSHSAELGGAPMLALNLVRELGRTMNVTTLLLGDGPLVYEFRKLSTDVYLDKAARTNNLNFDRRISRLVLQKQFAFAIVNSVESRVAVRPLEFLGVRTILLMHEFVSYIRPIETVRDALQCASLAVFSSELTLKQAMNFCDLALEDFSHKILPQGMSSYRPKIAGSKKVNENLPAIDEVLFLGAGTVEYRKGVDIFVSVASLIANNWNGTKKPKFIWIGDGFSPDTDSGYSSFLKDQVGRSGLGNQFSFLPASDSYDVLLKAASVLLIPSRLDPLPNVGLDAIENSIPIVSFKNATGFSEIFENLGLGSVLNAGYLDQRDMAEKALNLATNESEKKDLQKQFKRLALSNFSMDKYAQKLTKEGLAFD